MHATGPFVITEAAEKLGPIFVRHGYAFLYLFRRGQGLSADQGPFMQDVFAERGRRPGERQRQHVQFCSDDDGSSLDDVLAGLSVFEEPCLHPRLAHRKR